MFGVWASVLADPVSHDTGLLVLVVGPSGAGKDSVIDGAITMPQLKNRAIRVRRTITRPAGAGGENHKAATEEEFADLLGQGEFVLHWKAHGLSYGIPTSIRNDLDTGKIVIANISRSVIGQAREKFPTAIVINITARVDILAHRLAGRGRESAAEIEARLRHSPPPVPHGERIYTLKNNGELEVSIAKFIEVTGDATRQ